jgi:valyl-tRNA synthetase
VALVAARSPWPDADELSPAHESGDIAVLEMTAWVLGEVRKAKTKAGLSMRARVAILTVVDEPEHLALLRQAEADLRDAGGVDELVMAPGPPEVIVELAREEGLGDR